MTKNRYLEPCPECGQYKYEDDDCSKCEVRQEIAFRERLAKSKPTQLPWRVQHNEVNSDLFDANGQHIATVFPHCNAKHIVDCVNAPAIDAGEVERLVDAASRVMKSARHTNSLATEWAVPCEAIEVLEAALAAVRKGGEA